MTKEEKITLSRIIISFTMIICFHFMALSDGAKFFAYISAYLIIGFDILIKAAKGIKNRQVFDENFLMSVATLGAVILAVFKTGDYTEAVAVMLFYQIGEMFQNHAVEKSRKNISQLMDIRPDYANIEVDGKIQRIDPDSVQIGDVIIVLPGEKIAIDGTIIKGESFLNTAALNGESRPHFVKEGDEVLSGWINLNSVLKVKTTQLFSQSTASKILDLVENASARKSKSENFISKFARIYTPLVCYAALMLALLPPLIRMFILNLPSDWDVWIYRSLTFLVISCPCALVISIPLSFFAAIGGASKAGILIKGSNYIETFARTKIFVFDKTGTLTKGVFEVCDIHHNVFDKEKIIEYAALAESASSHPVAKSIRQAHAKEINTTRVSDIVEHSGKGICAKVDERNIVIGNDTLMKQFNIQYVPCHTKSTIIHMAVDSQYAGHIVIADIVKPESKELISALKKEGINKITLLSGDNRQTSGQVAQYLGIQDVHSELLPAQKVQEVEKLLKCKAKKETLAFVGDGMNDAPVLSRSDIGIAMGSIGSDAAIEAADIVLMDDNPLKILTALRISRKCMKIVYQNIWFALSIKIFCLMLGALGLADMWLAVFADVGVMVIAVFNAIRALSIKNL